MRVDPVTQCFEILKVQLFFKGRVLPLFTDILIENGFCLDRARGMRRFKTHHELVIALNF